MINTAFLTDSPLFRNLDETERAQILIIGQVRAFKKDEVIFREGDAGDGLFIVANGSVRISKQSVTGEEALAIPVVEDEATDAAIHGAAHPGRHQAEAEVEA